MAEKVTQDVCTKLLKDNEAHWVKLDKAVVNRIRVQYENACEFEELIRKSNLKPLFFVRCTDQACRLKLKQQMFKCNVNDSKYSGRSFQRHLDRAIDARQNRKRKLQPANSSEPTLKKFCFSKTPKEIDIERIRRAQALAISNGTIPLSSFNSEAMIKITRAMLAAVIPEDDAEILADRFSTSARTLRRLAEADEDSNKILIRNFAEKIITTFSATIIFDHQHTQFGDSSLGKKRLGVILNLKNKELQEMNILLGYTPCFSSAAEPTKEMLESILLDYGLFDAVQNGCVSTTSDTASRPAARLLCPESEFKIKNSASGLKIPNYGS